jgi:hypothetical protein
MKPPRAKFPLNNKVILPAPWKKISASWCLIYNHGHNWKIIKAGKECRDCGIKSVITN